MNIQNTAQVTRDFLWSWWLFNRTVWRHQHATISWGWRRYRVYVSSFVLSGVLLCICGKKALLLYCTYVYLRHVDDVIDGDLDLPRECTLADFVSSCDDLIESRGGTASPYLPRAINVSLKKSYEYQSRYDCDISQDIAAIWSVMKWDLARRGQQVSDTELIQYATKQDIAGGSMLCKMAGVYSRKIGEMIEKAQGYIARRDWLQDRTADLAQGINNVPLGHDPQQWWDTESAALSKIRNTEIAELKDHLLSCKAWWMRIVKILVDTH